MNNKTLKKCWLITSIILPIFTVGIAVYFLVRIKDPVFKSLFNNNVALDNLVNLFWLLSISFLFSIIGFLILFFCSYRKPGTTFLTFCLFCQCLSMFYDIYDLGKFQGLILTLNKIHGSKVLISFFRKFQLFNLLSISLASIWTFFSIKLRQINKSIQLDRILIVPEYNILFQNLRTATNCEDLRLKYQQSVRKNPEIAWHLKKTFKEKYTQLNSSKITSSI